MRAAVAVARGYGLEVTDPRVVRDLSNVLVHLAPLPVVARVATTTAAVRPDGARAWLARDVEMARWLAARGAAVVVPVDELPPGPHSEDGFALTFWRLVDPRAERPSATQAGRELRALHVRLDGFRGALPTLASVLDEAQGLIDRCQLSSLREPLHATREVIESLERPARPLHGDAHAGNLLRTEAGLLWTDFEDSCAGPVEWDLGCLVFTSSDPPAALDAYGYEGEREALAPFVEARALQVTAWAALMAEHHPHLRPHMAQLLQSFSDRESAGRARRPAG